MAANDADGYKIWGVDNVVYGPVELPVLVGWVREERVSGDSWVYVENAQAWRRAAELDELKMFFRKQGAPRPLTGYDTELMQRAPGLKPGSLRRIKIFSALSDDELAKFVKFIEVREVKQFSEIVKQGDPGDGMYFILEGEVRVRLMIGGKESILATLGAGDFFGEIALFDHGPRSADVITNEPSVLLRVSASSFQRLVSEAPELAAPFLFAMGKTLTSRIRADNKRFRDSVAFARGAQ